MGIETENHWPFWSVVGPESLKQAASIMDNVGSHMDIRIFPGDELPVHPDNSIFLIKWTHS